MVLKNQTRNQIFSFEKPNQIFSKFFYFYLSDHQRKHKDYWKYDWVSSNYPLSSFVCLCMLPTSVCLLSVSLGLIITYVNKENEFIESSALRFKFNYLNQEFRTIWANPSMFTIEGNIYISVIHFTCQGVSRTRFISKKYKFTSFSPLKLNPQVEERSCYNS